MLRILDISAENFLSYPQFYLDLRARGPILIIGENYDSGVASSNGSGKSAIAESILWGLFGTTARKVLADDVIKYDQSKCLVRIRATVDDREVEVVRSRTRGGPDTLTVNGQSFGSSVREAQNALCEWIKISPAVATNAIVFGQGLTQFAGATDSERGQLLKQLLQLEVITKAREAVRKDLRIRKDERTGFGYELSSLEDARERTETMLKDWESVVAQSEETIRKTATEMVSTLELLETYSIDRTETRVELIFLSNELSDLDKQYRKEQVEGLSLERTIGDLRNKIESIERLTQCPTCLQDVSDDHKQNVVREWNSSLEEALANKKLITARLDELTQLCEGTSERVSTLKLDLVHSDPWIDVTSVQRRLKSTIRDSKGLIAKKRELTEEMSTISSKITRLEQSINDIDKAINRFEFWDKGFSDKGIPTLLLEKSVDSLNLFVRRYSDILLDGFDPQFSLSRETGSGEKWGMAVQVLKDGRDVYKGMSGGEKQRVNLAVSFALFDLLRTRVTPVSPVVLDEVFINLDEVGSERVYRLVQGLPVETILVITHDARLANLFENAIVIQKKDGVSRIV
jgi:DNA repair exonuclease SbcCD ATPase subunit